jgi:pimeloyl-ACP methyl ester carboxylesterase
MYYEESGNRKAPVIVFIHGGGVGGWMWKRQAEAFQDYHCIIPDLPEHGKSMGESPLTIPDCAEQVAKLIRDTTDCGRAHMVGHSLGAKIIVELLSRDPDVVDHAVIVSALFRPMPLLRLFSTRPMYRLTVQMLRNKALLEMQVKQFGFPDEAYRKNSMEAFRLLTVDSLSHIYGELYRHLRLPPNLAQAKAPCLVMAGEREPRAMRESVRDIAGALPCAKGVLMKNARHDIPWKYSDAFNLILRQWITKESIASSLIINMNERM